MTRIAWAGVIFLSLATASVYASCGARLFHTLENRPEWISTKAGLERDAIGSLAFIRTPMALHGDALTWGPGTDSRRSSGMSPLRPGVHVFVFDFQTKNPTCPFSTTVRRAPSRKCV